MTMHYIHIPLQWRDDISEEHKEAYKRYGASHTTPGNSNAERWIDRIDSVKPIQHSIDSFILELNSNEEFRKKWMNI